MRFRLPGLFMALTLLSGCITGDAIRSVQPGMSRAQVIQVLGQPTGYQSSGGYEALHYGNQLTSGWSWDRADYFVILREGRVVEYGHGEVRPGPQPNTLILFQPQQPQASPPINCIRTPVGFTCS